MSKFFNYLLKNLSGDNGSSDASDDWLNAFPRSGNDFTALVNFNNSAPPPGGDFAIRASGGGRSGGGSSTSSSATVKFTASGSNGFKWSGIPFSATASEGYIFPPDNAMAVNSVNSSGNQTVVSSENGVVRIDVVNVASGSDVSTVQSLWNTLFGAPKSGFFYTDPRSFYDATAGRFVVTVDEVNPNAAQSYVVYAVSNSANPTSFSSGWTVHSVSTTSGSTWSDQPLAAVNGGNLYITTNQYTAGASGTYQYDNMAIIPNYASSASVTRLSSFSGPSAQAATVEDGSSPTQYFVSHDGTNLDITAFNGTTETSSFQIGGMPGLTLDSEYSENQKGTAYTLDASDGRVTSAVYDAKNNLLYALFETGTSSAPTDELVQINLSTDQVSDTLQLNSLLPNSPAPSTGSTSGAGTFNGSLAVDSQGDLLVNYSVSGPNMYAADYYAAWKESNGVAPTPTASNYSTLYDYQDSAAAYIDPNNDPIGRWGDYSTAIPNPSASNAFFISNEYDNGAVNYLFFLKLNSWGTVSANVNLA